MILWGVMTGKNRLNLVGVAWPLCLLKCNQAVQQMGSGEKLEVMFKDKDVIPDMIRLVTRTGPCQVKVEKHSTHISLHLIKLKAPPTSG